MKLRFFWIVDMETRPAKSRGLYEQTDMSELDSTANSYEQVW